MSGKTSVNVTIPPGWRLSCPELRKPEQGEHFLGLNGADKVQVYTGGSCIALPLSVIVKKVPSICLVTSFNKAIYEASGKRFLESYHKYASSIPLAVFYEDIKKPDVAYAQEAAAWPWFCYVIAKQKDIIHKDFGGPAGDDVFKVDGKVNWFRKHWYRWFRKIAAWHWVVGKVQPDKFVWVDADCFFLQETTADWFDTIFDNNACIYLKSKRTVWENGVIGWDLNLGEDLLTEVFSLYHTGDFRKLQRWDDCYSSQKVVGKHKKIPSKDIATTVGKHSDVVTASAVGKHISHDKGRHGRVLRIYR